MYNLYGYNPLIYYPFLPNDCDLPPTLYSIMQSIVNYGKFPKEKIKNLAKESRTTLFDFDYPLSENVSRETFETNILNHFIERRIGFDTVTMFQIKLNNRLNEIMPKYNLMFDSLKDWNLFKDGFTIEKTGHVTDIKNQNVESSSDTTGSMNTENETKAKHSDLPQSELQDIDDSKYVNIYENNTNVNGSTSSTSNTSSEESLQNTNNNYEETIKQSQSDLVETYIKFQNSINSIYTMIYNDLDCLFYGLL